MQSGFRVFTTAFLFSILFIPQLSAETAIAVGHGSDGRWTFTIGTNVSSLQQAESDALRFCLQHGLRDCRIAGVSYANECMALAVKKNNYTVAVTSNEFQAKQNALKNCNNTPSFDSCGIIYSGCDSTGTARPLSSQPSNVFIWIVMVAGAFLITLTFLSSSTKSSQEKRIKMRSKKSGVRKSKTTSPPIIIKAPRAKTSSPASQKPKPIPPTKSKVLAEKSKPIVAAPAPIVLPKPVADVKPPIIGEPKPAPNIEPVVEPKAVLTPTPKQAAAAVAAATSPKIMEAKLKRKESEKSPALPVPKPQPPAPPIIQAQSSREIVPVLPPTPQLPLVLKLKRSKKEGTFGATIYMLDARIDVNAETAAVIAKHGFGKRLIYESADRQLHSARANAHLAGSNNIRSLFGSNAERTAGAVKTVWKLGRAAVSATRASFALRVTVDSLRKGIHVECKSMEELLEAEEAFRNAKENLEAYIETAQSFDGREEII